MTDRSIISRDTIRARGAHAFDQGRGVDDHHMNPGAEAIRDWQFGWHTRRIERAQKRRDQFTDAGNMVDQQLEEAA